MAQHREHQLVPHLGHHHLFLLCSRSRLALEHFCGDSSFPADLQLVVSAQVVRSAPRANAMFAPAPVVAHRMRSCLCAHVFSRLASASRACADSIP